MKYFEGNPSKYKQFNHKCFQRYFERIRYKINCIGVEERRWETSLLDEV
jgi:hypothetical protein